MHVPSVTKAWGDYTTHDRAKRGCGRWLSSSIGCTVNIYQSATFCTPSFSLSESFSLLSPITFLQGSSTAPKCAFLCQSLLPLQTFKSASAAIVVSPQSFFFRKPSLNKVSLWKEDLGKWRMNQNCSHSAVIKMSLQLCNKQMKSKIICSIKSDVYITPIQAHMGMIPTQTAGFNA